MIPLDGDYDGNEIITSKALKHGCTNDVRQLWKETADDLTAFRADTYKFDSLLQDELIRIKLLTRPGTEIIQKQDNIVTNNKLKRVKSISNRKWTRISNTHLVGTELGGMLKLIQN